MIDAYDFGRITINGKTYRSDVVVFWNGKVAEWWRKEGHRVHLEDVVSILDAKPEAVIFGTGKYGAMRVGSDVIDKLESEGIEVYTAITEKATRKFNELVKKKRTVLAAHLTC